MYKFRTIQNVTHHTNVIVNNNTEEETESNLENEAKNRLQLEFTADLAVAALVPVVVVFILNGIFGHRIKTTPR